MTTMTHRMARWGGARLSRRLRRSVPVIGGVIAVVIGTTYLYWGEETLGVLQLVAAGLLYFAPLILPGLFGITAPNEAGSAALAAIQTSGIVAGVIAIFVLLADVASRIKLRAQQGARADARASQLARG